MFERLPEGRQGMVRFDDREDDDRFVDGFGPLGISSCYGG
jgi:hypothetical protein